MINQIKYSLVWLRRIMHCRGFGIQSPVDYAFVRYVINEHWPYYCYDTMEEKDWLRRKLGQLYMRLANWRRPTHMKRDEYEQWWKAGSQRIVFCDTDDCTGLVELERIKVDERDRWEALKTRCDQHSVVVVEDISRDWARWHEMEGDAEVGTTFDLYYCGIVFFDTNRYRHHYVINF